MSLDGGRAISTRRPTCGAYAEGTPSRATLVSELFAGSCDSPPVARSRPAPQRMGVPAPSRAGAEAALARAS